MPRVYCLHIGGSKGGTRDAFPPLGPILSFSCSFQEFFDQIIYWRPPPLGLGPTPLGNPGSATASVMNFEARKENYMYFKTVIEKLAFVYSRHKV